MAKKGQSWRKQEDLPRPDLPRLHSENRLIDKITASFSDKSLRPAIDKIVEDGDYKSRSEWIEEAAREKLERDGASFE